MNCRMSSFVFLLIFLPSIVQALKCSYGGTCEIASKWNTEPPKLTTFKNCKESCVYFLCFFNGTDGNRYLKHGYGCPEDVERLCSHASNRENGTKNVIFGKDFLICYCNDSDDCMIKKTRKASKSVKAEERSVSKNVTTSNTIIDQSADEKCIYDEDEESILASGEIFFEEFYEEEESYFNKKYITFLVCFIVIFFGPYVYYELFLGYL